MQMPVGDTLRDAALNQAGDNADEEWSELAARVRDLELPDRDTAARYLRLGIRVGTLFPGWDADAVAAVWTDTGHTCLRDDEACYVCEQMEQEGWL